MLHYNKSNINIKMSREQLILEKREEIEHLITNILEIASETGILTKHEKMALDINRRKIKELLAEIKKLENE